MNRIIPILLSLAYELAKLAFFEESISVKKKRTKFAKWFKKWNVEEGVDWCKSWSL